MTDAPKPGVAGLRVLHVGSLHLDPLRRWTEHAARLGCEVLAAGHLRRGRARADLGSWCGSVHAAPDGLADLGVDAQAEWLRGVVGEVRPDIVHAHQLPRWGRAATLAFDGPVAVTAWGSDVYLATGEDRASAGDALRAAAAITAPSPHMLRVLAARGAPAARLHHVDLGVDLVRFRPADPGAGGPVVLSFRAGTELYNLDVVLAAFRLLRHEHPRAELVVVHGDAPLAPAVRAQLDAPGGRDGVRLLGRVPHAEMPRHLRAATVGISIPRSDGSPNSVWEALACGLPVVLSDLPQIEERVGPSGAAALVAPSADAVAGALGALLADGDLRGRMSRAGRAWAVANVDERREIERLGSVYAALGR